MNVSLDEVLSEPQHHSFVQAWNLLAFKLDKTASSLSSNDFGAALFYIRAAHWDSVAMLSLLQKAGRRVHSSIACASVTPLGLSTAHSHPVRTPCTPSLETRSLSAC